MEKALKGRTIMKTIKLKKSPSFYEDLSFSHWLTQGWLLAVVLDRNNHVKEVDLDKKYYREVLADLKSKHYA